jgi:hypothetical protein
MGVFFSGVQTEASPEVLVWPSIVIGADSRDPPM